MIKFLKFIPYHAKSAVKSVKRNFAMSISSATAVTVTLTLVMLFLVIAGNINEMSKKVESSVQIFVQIDPILAEDQYPTLEEEIKSIKNVANVKFSSKDEQFDTFIKSDDGGSEYEMFRDDNPLAAAYYIDATEGKYVKSITEKLKKMDGVMSASFGGDSATEMLDAFDSIRLGGGILVVALCFLAIFLISNTIKITIHARNSEIAIMRNVGADNLFIKTPFMFEGMMIGLMGSIIPVVFTIAGYYYLYDLMDGKMFSSLFSLQSPMPFVVYISLSLVALGMLVGLVGSFLSVNKYLKWKR